MTAAIIQTFFEPQKVSCRLRPSSSLKKFQCFWEILLFKWFHNKSQIFKIRDVINGHTPWLCVISRFTWTQFVLPLYIRFSKQPEFVWLSFHPIRIGRGENKSSGEEDNFPIIINWSSFFTEKLRWRYWDFLCIKCITGFLNQE